MTSRARCVSKGVAVISARSRSPSVAVLQDVVIRTYRTDQHTYRWCCTRPVLYISRHRPRPLSFRPRLGSEDVLARSCSPDGQLHVCPANATKSGAGTSIFQYSVCDLEWASARECIPTCSPSVTMLALLAASGLGTNVAASPCIVRLRPRILSQ